MPVASISIHDIDLIISVPVGVEGDLLEYHLSSPNPLNFIAADDDDDILPYKRSSEMNEESKDFLHTARNRVFKDFLQNERAYIDKLYDLQFNFMEPLSVNNSKYSLSKREVTVIFGSLQSVYEISCVMTNRMERAEDKLIEAIISLTDCIPTYKEYVSRYESSMDQLQIAGKNKKFHKFLSEKSSRGFNLESLLGLPIHRIQKYEFFLRDILRQSLDSDENLDGLCDTYRAFKAFAADVYDIKQKYEKISDLLELQKKISNTPKGFILRSFNGLSGK